MVATTRSRRACILLATLPGATAHIALACGKPSNSLALHRSPPPTAYAPEEPPPRADEGGDCAKNVPAAVNAVQEVAKRKIVKGSWKGDSAAVRDAAKVRDAAAAAAQDSDPTRRAELSDDDTVALADCLAGAGDVTDVDNCMADYCQADEECALDYKEAESEGEVESEVAATRGRALPPLRSWLLGRATLVDSSGGLDREHRPSGSANVGSKLPLRRRLFGRFF